MSDWRPRCLYCGAIVRRPWGIVPVGPPMPPAHKVCWRRMLAFGPKTELAELQGTRVPFLMTFKQCTMAELRRRQRVRREQNRRVKAGELTDKAFL